MIKSMRPLPWRVPTPRGSRGPLPREQGKTTFLSFEVLGHFCSQMDVPKQHCSPKQDT